MEQKATSESKQDFNDLELQAVKWMRSIGHCYPDCGFGLSFDDWIHSNNPQPYYSFGNGSAMRVSGCAYAAGSLTQAKAVSLCFFILFV